ncbi:DUF4450 domain-containing protein [Pelagicoccus sp. SDUM812005]|uniref:DUF4450 domain-containing protein n=1 Tax=Pelagicoccus sp. SDUM812005 TaxID=3041257 RepID=UPI00280DB3DA|nr:DUF4450 domain-containing protein [Pelagicoccus sp. SDUM812005]MDQ8179163.1 DUF4450 domain-containing protein [Pelagicoccus sp. SDUM812005]
MLLVFALLAAASPFRSTSPETLGQQLRYQPDNGAFVAIHDFERFNRPLYGGNTAFRVDGGDIPEFVLYLPGRGGNLRFAIQRGDTTKWIHEADNIEPRYVPGSLAYRIKDKLLENAELELTALGSYQSESFFVQIDCPNAPKDLRILAVYGGLNGQRGKRDGDIGTEDVPISEWFQLKPEFCRDNVFTYSPQGQSYRLTAPKGRIQASLSQDAKLKVVDAACWQDPERLAQQASIPTPVQTDRPLIVSTNQLNGDKLYFSWEKLPSESEASQSITPDQLPERYAANQKIRQQRASQLEVHTPDPYFDAAVAALCIGADATWDEPQQAVMHGAIAWRRKLLGWRGPYAMDALGWHDRAKAHLEYWSTRQDTSPIPDKIPGPDEDGNLARAEAALHSNGTLSHSHYDMNLVYFDALFRHLRWTGDIEFGKQLWPVIERHLAWERRLFRREFEVAGEKLPLYEAYAAIWASDEMSYNGGGVAYTSAYNAFHNREAARLARLIGEDPSPYLAEAEAIEKAMRKLLWVEDGNASYFAEYKDWIGLQRQHKAAGVWSVYHTLDSQVPSPEEAYQMTRYVDQSIPHRRLSYPQLSDQNPIWVFASSHWFPYDWSVNNVVMGENIHTALAYWQAGRPEEAWSLTKGSLIASMFAGICPGNVGSMNFLDAYRGESQRDFADGSGVTSRAVVEGLFGVQPNLLEQSLTLRPGIPNHWDFAQLKHSSIELDYQKSATTVSLSVTTQFPPQTELILQLPLGTAPDSIRLDGQRPRSLTTLNENGHGYLEARFAPNKQSYTLSYSNEEKAAFTPPDFKYTPPVTVEPVDWTQSIAASRTTTVDLGKSFNAKVTDIFQQEYRSPRSPFTSLAIPKQGIGGWAGAYKRQYEVNDQGLRQAAAAKQGQIHLPNQVPLASPPGPNENNIAFVSLWDNYPDAIDLPLSGNARRAYLLLAGSTNWMQSHIDNGVVVFHYTDGNRSELALHNPTTWWPIDQDYFVDDFQFQHPGPFPLRLDLASGNLRHYDPDSTADQAYSIVGGSATVLAHTLDPQKQLSHLELKALSTEVVIGLMALTLEK